MMILTLWYFAMVITTYLPPVWIHVRPHKFHALLQSIARIAAKRDWCKYFLLSVILAAKHNVSNIVLIIISQRHDHVAFPLLYKDEWLEKIWRHVISLAMWFLFKSWVMRVSNMIDNPLKFNYDSQILPSTSSSSSPMNDSS